MRLPPYAIYFGTHIQPDIQVEREYIQGTLDAAGRANCPSRVAKGEPFFFEVQGRVSAIVGGALLLTEDPGVEYGGAFFDWALADEAESEESFWAEYESQRKHKEVTVTTFWQHDHITRRRIRARQSYIDAFPVKEVIIQAIPIQIRVGPLIRHTSDDCATIWTELETLAATRSLQMSFSTSTLPRLGLVEGTTRSPFFRDWSLKPCTTTR